MTHLDKLDGIKKKKANTNSIADFLETTDDYKIRNEKGGKHVIFNLFTPITELQEFFFSNFC